MIASLNYSLSLKVVVPVQCTTVCVRFLPGDDFFLFQLVYFGKPTEGSLVSGVLFHPVDSEVAWSVVELIPPV